MGNQGLSEQTQRIAERARELVESGVHADVEPSEALAERVGAIVAGHGPRRRKLTPVA